MLYEAFVDDLNVTEPETVLPAMAQRLHDLPGREKWIAHKATGFAPPLGNGSGTIRGGRHVGVFPGRPIRNNLPQR